MQITTAARRITRTLNATGRTAGRTWVIQFDDQGHETHRHEQGTVTCPTTAAHTFSISPGSRYTQRHIQECLTPTPLDLDNDAELAAAFLGEYA